MDLKSKIILISGPTASGKSELAIKFAKKVNGEIINADSMQVYKELKILTARPIKENINKNSSDQTQIKKQRGNQSNNKENNVPEKGSVKGKSKIEITCLRCIRPNYPTRALRRGAEGKPLVKVWINKIGNVTKSELIKSSGNDSIDKAALLAANKSTFFPISIDTTLQIEYDLKIKK